MDYGKAIQDVREELRRRRREDAANLVCQVALKLLVAATAAGKGVSVQDCFTVAREYAEVALSEMDGDGNADQS